ncbi:hypothetical protein N7478_007068 [Penicillium angulare]|uniref:uncharacterized protein n=1 Tax=Penicillium angulare TaxID=116970 RepID=UPI0025404075|nr:uncharacterized protein N7478_007068 [Penicillium angulare]KAJ5281696.1 hypothetical protein N7478_007068 [Penicillium angulare]
MSSTIPSLLSIGEEVTDVEEESFLLFAQDIPTTNLGFLDSRAAAVEVSIRGNEYTIHQSPTLLSSSRAGGTTGAVLWKITPLFAEWISSPDNPLWTSSFLTHESIITELGCGISALIPLALSPSIQHYIATDQEYVRRYFRTNIDENISANNTAAATSKKKVKGASKAKKASKSSTSASAPSSNVTFTTLDWETDQPSFLKGCIEGDEGIQRHGIDEEDKGFDLILSCDCIYNDALVTPFVRTCAEICRLRPAYNPESEPGDRKPTVCLVAQQQRAPEVFDAWLKETLREFRVWRVSDEILGDGLKVGTGYLVHMILLRE